MGFVESIIRALDGCMVGFLELLTLFLVGAAAFLGTRTYQKHKQVVEKLAHHHKVPIKKPSWWPFLILLTLAIGFTWMTLWKYMYMAR